MIFSGIAMVVGLFSIVVGGMDAAVTVLGTASDEGDSAGSRIFFGLALASLGSIACLFSEAVAYWMRANKK